MARVGFEILGPTAQPAVAGLKEIAASRDSRTRYDALVCLNLVMAEKESFLPALTRGLNDSDENVRHLAARLLHRSFPDDAKALGVYEVYPLFLDTGTNMMDFE
jgi:HEAT repeat protein